MNTDPPLHAYEVTITIPYRATVPLDPEALGRFLELILSADYENPRSFDANLFYHGLQHCLQTALRDNNDSQMQERYGAERIPNADGMGWCSRWCLEAEKNPLPVPYQCGAARVEMRQVDEG